MKISNRSCFLLFITMLISIQHIRAEVKIPAVLSNGMVLQQQSNVPIWGWSTPGESINVRCNWSKQKVTVNADDSGKWKAMVATPIAGGPYTIIITGKSNTISIEDVLKRLSRIIRA